MRGWAYVMPLLVEDVACSQDCREESYRGTVATTRSERHTCVLMCHNTLTGARAANAAESSADATAQHSTVPIKSGHIIHRTEAHMRISEPLSDQICRMSPTAPVYRNVNSSPPLCKLAMPVVHICHAGCVQSSRRLCTLVAPVVYTRHAGRVH